MSVIMVVVFGFGIYALDISLALNAQHKARRIAETAVLYTIDEIKDEVLSGHEDDLEREDLELMARSVFESHLQRSNINLNQLALVHTVLPGEHFIDLDYEVSVAKLVEDANIDIKDSVTAAVRFEEVAEYLSINLLLDFTGSMSTGASFADQMLMWEHQGCAFACHEQTIDEARSLGIELRQDKLVQALHVLLDAAEFVISHHDISEDTNRFSFYTHIDTETEHLSSTTDLGAARQVVDSLYDTTPAGQTNLGAALNALKDDHLAPNGDGTAPDERRNFLFVITDGLSSRGPLTHLSSQRIGLLPERICDNVKADGTTLAIIYTTYENYAESMRAVYGSTTRSEHYMHSYTYPEWQYHYQIYARHPVNHAAQVLEDCASPGFYFEASDGEGLSRAVRRLFEQAMREVGSVPRISYSGGYTLQITPDTEDSDEDAETEMAASAG